MSEMTPETPENSRKARVNFGGKPWQNIPHDCAAWMLTTWRERDPKRFGELLRDALMRDQ